jgi:hypothetical protein
MLKRPLLRDGRTSQVRRGTCSRRQHVYVDGNYAVVGLPFKWIADFTEEEEEEEEEHIKKRRKMSRTVSHAKPAKVEAFQ